MKTLETLEFQLPAPWASYLINGDASGLEPDEKAIVDQWLIDNDNPRFCDCSEQYFAHWHEAFYLQPLAGDVCDYTALSR